MIEQIPVIVIAFLQVQSEFIKQIKISRADNTLFRVRTDSHEIIYPV